MTRIRMTSIAALLLATATYGHATQILATPPANANFQGWYMECAGTNASTSQKFTVVLEIDDYTGVAIKSSVPVAINPGETFTYSPSGDSSAASCVFKVVGGSSKSLRGAANYWDNLGHLMIVNAR